EGGGERTGPIEMLTGRDDLAGQTPVEGIGGLQLLRCQRHPHGPMPTRRRGDECRGTAVGHEPDLGEREHEVGVLAHHHVVAGQGQRAADAGGGAGDCGDRGIGASMIDRMIAFAWPSSMSSLDPASPRRSAPELNARSLPVRMRAREFAAASATASPMARNVDWLSALRLWGRLIVMVVTSPLTSVRTLVDNATPSYVFGVSVEGALRRISMGLHGYFNVR